MVANLLSVLRLLMLPPLLYVLQRSGPGVATGAMVLLAAAAATDLADGVLARRLGQTSRLGRVLDPLADKVLLGGLVFGLVAWRGFPPWVLVALLARDAAIVLAGSVLLGTRGLVIPANRLGKCATVSIVLAATTYLLDLPAAARTAAIGLAAAMLVLSSLGYVRVLRHELRQERRRGLGAGSQ
ncbi:MAG: CDP-alcohol phosphatidyltransferase family protein [Candidatus Latescibacterota bacterium]